MRNNFVIIFIVTLLVSIGYVKGEETDVDVAHKPDRVERKIFKGVAGIDIDHKYGNVTVNEINTKEVSLEIHYFDSGKRKAQCEVSQTASKLLIKTLSSNSKSGVRINYIINKPKQTALSADLKYGDLQANAVSGKFDVQIKYGDLNIGSFSKITPNIDLQYGSLSIGDVRNIDLAVSYSNVIINKVDILNFSGKYNRIEIRDIKSINMQESSAYNSYKINKMNGLKANLKYDELVIDDLESMLNLVGAYSDIKVGIQSVTPKDIKITGAYTDISIDLDPKIAAKIESVVTYGDMNISKAHNITKISHSKQKNTSIKSVVIGNPSKAATTIVIVSSYSDVDIK